MAGASVNVVELGEGEPIVFVHGLAGCWQNWLENLPHFGAQRRTLAMDLPGFSGSPVPSWALTIPNYAGFMRDFCRSLGIESAVFVGSSMGAFICAELAITEPDLVEKLVLVDAAGLSHLRPYTRAERTLARAAIAAGPYLTRLQRPGILRRRLRRVAFGRTYAHPELLRPELLWEQTMPALRSPGYRQAVEKLIGHDYRARLGSIEAPTLIVWGRRDRVVPVESAYAYRERIPGARLEIFEDTGHLPQLEQPERFNRLIEEFLAEGERSDC